MAGVGIAIAVAGAAVSISLSLVAARNQAKQARAQGKAQQAMANYNAEVAENRQTAANQNAEAETKIAAEQTRRQRDENRRLRDKQLTIQAKSGGEFSGSALLIDQDQLAEMKLQELDTLHQGEMKAREHKLQGMSAGAEATGSRFQGNLAREGGNRRAKSIITQSYYKAGQTAASTASKVGSSYAM